MHYHLTQQQRIELSLLVRLGHSQRNTALVLGVSPSTICRELKRNTKPSSTYHPIFARLATKARRITANQQLRKFHGNVELEKLVTSKLTLQWSPEQIAGWLKRHGVAMRVCAQTIYDWLYSYREDLRKYLRSQKQHYRRTRANTLRKHRREALAGRIKGWLA